MSTKNTCSQTKTVKPQFLKFLSHIASIPFAYCRRSFRILQVLHLYMENRAVCKLRETIKNN